jgi:DNA-binding response OmpR family regulator
MSHDGPFALDSLSNRHLLLVDDNADGLSPLAAILRHCGALVIEAASDAHALRLLDQVKPDAIVVVIPRRMRSPLPLVGRVRGRKPEHGGVVPIVVIADEGATFDRDGVTAVMTRPLEPWRLCVLIAGLVGQT